MAKQNPNPPEWKPSMSDGCSGVFEFGYHDCCVAHDKAYHYGGSAVDKLKADLMFYADMRSVPGIWGWLAGHGWARIRYEGIRILTHNYPPDHPKRSRWRIESWNWLSQNAIH